MEPSRHPSSKGAASVLPQPLVLALLLALLLLSGAAPGALCARHSLQGQVLYPLQQGTPSAPMDARTPYLEAAALIQLRKALNNHPAFNGFTPDPTWADAVTVPHAPWSLNASLANATGFQNFQATPCSAVAWAYLLCSAQGRVVEINLNGGQITRYNASWAQSGADPITGYIPWAKMTALQALEKLDVGIQTISGSLDGVQHFPSLNNLTLSLNQFSGSVPEEVSKLTNLVDLRIDDNKLSGVLPQTLSTLTGLGSLSLGVNSFTGTFPAWIGNLKNLHWIDLSSNAFTGAFPASWGQLTRLTGMQLQFTSPAGSLPDAWSGMKSLRHISCISCGIQSTYPAVLTKLPKMIDIWMGSNKLYGPLPTNIIVPSLTSLVLENNYFNGSAPVEPANANAALGVKIDNNCFTNVSKNVNYNGRNASQCTAFYASLYPKPPPPYVATTPQSPQSSSNTVIIVVIVLVILFVLGITGGLAYWWWQSSRRSRISKLFTKGLRQTSQEFTLAELKQATQSWQAAIGKGGYGTVYKAELKDGSLVAVKRLDQVSKQGDVEFIREVELLSRVHHRHLVNLVGFCAERGERALIYEYMAMGSLYEHLHGDSAKQFPLSWDSRCKIAIHVALGIEYLHYGADPPLIHRDIKSANILLSDDGYSKVADFGLCKEAPIGAAADGSEQLVPTATAVRGSFGYLDPEYVNTSILSEKSDVYSYGVVLLELISGHKSIHDWQPLAYWAEEYLADREKTPLMVDPALEGNFDLDELYALCDIARTCVQDQSANRPTIRDVAKALVENLGHGMSSFTGSQQDTASIVTGSSQTDASSMPSTTYTPSSADQSNEFTYQNYSETLHWTPTGSGQVSKNGSGLTVSTGAKGDHLPVPVPKRPEAKDGKGGEGEA